MSVRETYTYRTSSEVASIKNVEEHANLLKDTQSQYLMGIRNWTRNGKQWYTMA